MGKRHQILIDLDAELARASEREGGELVWTAAEREVLAMIANTVDRREALKKRFVNSRDVKTAAKASGEIRLLDSLMIRLLKQVQPSVPAPMNATQLKNQRAANVRWARERERNAATG
ncbi:MAG: hypothetical protein K0U84_21835 [Actinomycetia bacterium]|nr:hypothetical protein [Actinomycetes bacterium]